MVQGLAFLPGDSEEEEGRHRMLSQDSYGGVPSTLASQGADPGRPLAQGAPSEGGSTECTWGRGSDMQGPSRGPRCGQAL